LVTQLRQLFPTDTFASTSNVIRVNEIRPGISKLFQDWTRYLERGHVAVVDGDERAPGRNRLLAAAPCKEITHGNHLDSRVLQSLHVLLEKLRRDAVVPCRGPL